MGRVSAPWPAPDDGAGQESLVLEMRGVSKRFGGTQALDGVNLRVARGEVHCLVGANGAGKSTLGKIIAGVIPCDDGEMTVAGRRVTYRSPRDALRDGIALVEQELSLVPAMTVAANATLGLRRRDVRGASGSRAVGLREHVADLNELYGLGVNLDRPVEELPASGQQAAEILRALAHGSRLVVLDEPTARLAAAEADNLRRIVKRLASAGSAVVLVSHFLDEVLAVADRISVLRDGRVVASVPAAGQTPGHLVEAMLGRRVSLEFPAKRLARADAPTVLSVRGVSSPAVRDVNLDVREGEIVGLAGLVGSGRTEVARLIFGADPYTHGTVLVDGQGVRRASVPAAIQAGIAYVPEDRKNLGLLLHLSNRHNITLPHLGLVSRCGVLRPAVERRITRQILDRLQVVPRRTGIRTGALSGGNQQRVLFAKWLVARPRLLIVDEPTRGVDVGARFALYTLLANLAAEGLAILLISSELEEVVGLAHRVVVMSRGRQVAELRGDDICEARIMQAAFHTAPADTAGQGALP